ncbi:MAG TPA: hypothetical protein VKX45_09765 [Bryobacteraceae bacterium]|jgi:hypothetical protein|nr:hypothetical protein [Bryobacteraceae bacterium]
MFGSGVAVEENQLAAVAEGNRQRALKMLYLRREAVDNLIRSLEAYQQTMPRPARCIPINAARKCS